MSKSKAKGKPDQKAKPGKAESKAKAKPQTPAEAKPAQARPVDASFEELKHTPPEGESTGIPTKPPADPAGEMIDDKTARQLMDEAEARIRRRILKEKSDAVYNAETVRLINEAEKNIRELAGDLALAKADTARKKKALELAENDFLEMVERREKERYQPTLFPEFNPAAEAGREMEREGLNSSPDFDLPPDEWQAKNPTPAASSEPEDLSWRTVRVMELHEKFGLQKKVAEAFEANGLETLGAVADYSTPKPGSSWIPNLTDKPGIGPKAVEKYQTAETLFYVKWNADRSERERLRKQNDRTGGDGSPCEPRSPGVDGSEGNNASAGGDAKPAPDSADPVAEPETRNAFAGDFNADEPEETAKE